MYSDVIVKVIILTAKFSTVLGHSCGKSFMCTSPREKCMTAKRSLGPVADRRGSATVWARSSSVGASLSTSLHAYGI